jgi:TonB family protein
MRSITPLYVVLLGAVLGAAFPASTGAALVDADIDLRSPLSADEARHALEREVSLKVGKHRREGDYPDEARRWGWSGTALVEVGVTGEGLIHEVVLSRSSGFRVLDERALEVVRRVQKLFVPAQLRGRPQRAIVPIGFQFQPQ